MRQTTIGAVLSELARKGLRTRRSYKIRNGVPVLPRVAGRVLTVDAVERMLDEE